MKQITFDEINRIIAELEALGEDVLDSELDLMFDEQPDITDFLMGSEGMNEVEESILLDVVQIGWYIIKKALNRNRPVSEEYLYRQFESNFEQYNERVYLSDKSDSEIAAELHAPNNQPDLVDYLIELIMETFEDPDKPIRDEYVNAMIVDAKTVIDCLVIDDEKAPA